MNHKKIIVIAGPTASGKSQLALAIAQECDAVIINADSMQVYAPIPVISAQPSASDMRLCPHLLYGMLGAHESCSAGKWLALAKEAIDSSFANGKQPVIVGGTGLYIRSLVEGLSPIPEINEEVRASVRQRFSELGNEAFHALLEAHDPIMASRLPVGDSQRMMRAMEVIEDTGISLFEWQKIPPIANYPKKFFTQITLVPPRPFLYNNCNNRFLTMLEQGALEEVEALLAQHLPPSLPAMKALGVPELAQFLQGKLTREEAITLAQTSTRHYAKRQLTWFRHQLPESQCFAYQGTEAEKQVIMDAIVLKK